RSDSRAVRPRPRRVVVDGASARRPAWRAGVPLHRAAPDERRNQYQGTAGDQLRAGARTLLPGALVEPYPPLRSSLAAGPELAPPGPRARDRGDVPERVRGLWMAVGPVRRTAPVLRCRL